MPDYIQYIKLQTSKLTSIKQQINWFKSHNKILSMLVCVSANTQNGAILNLTFVS